MVSDSSERYVRLNLILEEIAGRYRRGEQPSLQDYQKRYPDLADDLGEMFPAMAEIEQIKEDRKEKQLRPIPALQQLGDYRILREIGHGGMGVVYEAEQESLGRRVALKVLRSHTLMESRQVQRFQREARTAGRLHHTNIVPVFGVGEHDGLHYYVMQLICGQGLDQVLAELDRLRRSGVRDQGSGSFLLTSGESSLSDLAHSLHTGVFTPPVEGSASSSVTPDPSPLTPGEDRPPLSDSGRQYWQSVARIGIQAAEALAYAHSQGTLHRDIKPSNLLLDTQGTLWITDFGLAKASESDPDNLTRTGDVAGTLRYMAPERFQGKADARSDLYALGLTLYELLTLRPAFEEPERSRLLAQVLNDEPPRPRRLNPAVPRDLETVVLKAIARDPTHRYASAAQLAEDLKRFLDDKPIQARPISGVEKLWRWCRRNQAVASLIGAFVLSLLFGSAGITWKWWEAEQRRKEATEASEAADRARSKTQQVLAGVMLDKGIALAEQGEISEGLFWMLEGLKEAPKEAVELNRLIHTNLTAWTAHAHGLRQVLEQLPYCDRAVLTADGQGLVVSGRTLECYSQAKDGTWVREMATASLPRQRGELQNQSSPLALSPDGKVLLTSDRNRKGKEGHPQRWDFLTGEKLGAPLPHPRPVRTFAFTPDGKWIVTGCDDGIVRVWDPASCELVSDHFRHDKTAVLSLAISPDSSTVAVGTGDWEDHKVPAAAYLWDLTAGKRIGQPLQHKGEVGSIVFSPDGKTVLTGSWDGTTQLWEAATSKPVGLPMRHPREVLAARFSPDGRTIVTGGADGIVRWWDVATGYQLTGTLPLHRGAIRDLIFSSDGKTLVAISNVEEKSGTIHVFEMARPLSRPAGKGKEADLKAPWAINELIKWRDRHPVAYSPDAHQVLTRSFPGAAQLWDSFTGQPLGGPLRHSWKLVSVVACSPDGKVLATASEDKNAIGDACLWDAQTGKALGPPLPHLNWVSAMVFSPDGKLLVTGSYDWTIRFWDPATGKQIGANLSQGGVVQSLAFSPDGKTLAVGRARSGLGPAGVMLWSISRAGEPPASAGGVGTPQIRQIGQLIPAPHLILQFSSDGMLLLSATSDTFRLWDPATGKAVSSLASETSEINTLTFSPDSKRILIGSTDGTARLWDVQSEKPFGAPMLHGQRVNAVAFSPPGDPFILTGCGDGSARLWDQATHKPIGPPVVQGRAILALRFSPDGRSFVTTTEGGMTRVWPVPSDFNEEGDSERMALRLQVHTGLTMGPGQTVLRLSPREWEQRRQELVALEGSAESAYAGAVSERAFHEARARDAEQDSAHFAVKWHLDRLIAANQLNGRQGPWLDYARRGRVFTTAGEFEQAEADYARALALGTPEQLLAWYRHRVLECLPGQQWQAALWYLNRVLKADPRDWRLYADRAEVWDKLGKPVERDRDQDQAVERGADSIYLIQLADTCAERNEWPRSARLHALAGERGPIPSWAWSHVALAALKTGDHTQYSKVCTAIIKETGPAPPRPVANGAAWICALGPDALADYRPAVALAELVVRNCPAEQKPSMLNTLGAILYRAGRSREAIERLNEGIKAGQGQGVAHDWIFLALAHHRLGEANQAHHYLDLVKRRRPPTNLWERLELELLQQEAEAMGEGKPLP